MLQRGTCLDNSAPATTARRPRALYASQFRRSRVWIAHHGWISGGRPCACRNEQGCSWPPREPARSRHGFDVTMEPCCPPWRLRRWRLGRAAPRRMPRGQYPQAIPCAPLPSTQHAPSRRCADAKRPPSETPRPSARKRMRPPGSDSARRLVRGDRRDLPWRPSLRPRWLAGSSRRRLARAPASTCAASAMQAAFGPPATSHPRFQGNSKHPSPDRWLTSIEQHAGRVTDCAFRATTNTPGVSIGRNVLIGNTLGVSIVAELTRRACHLFPPATTRRAVVDRCGRLGRVTGGVLAHLLRLKSDARMDSFGESSSA